MACAHWKMSWMTRVLGLATTALLVLLITHTASATTICSYSINVSEDLSSLENGGASGLHTTAAEWVYLRKHPFIEITNTSNDPTDDITSLTIQMHNPTQNLSVMQTNINPVVPVPSDPFPTITSPSSLPTTPNGSVTLNFSNFAPGDSIIFRLELDPATSADSPFADYRQTMFTIGGTDNSQNASSAVTFQTTDGTVTAGPNQWANLPADLGSQTAFGIAFSCLNTPDTVIVPPVVTGSNSPVPEPSTLVLLGGLGLLGLPLARKKFSRQRR
jgi:hypothetical protein